MTNLTRDEMLMIMEKRTEEGLVEFGYVVYNGRTGKAFKFTSKAIAKMYVESFSLKPGYYLLVTINEWEIIKNDILNSVLEPPDVFQKIKGK